MTGQMHDIVEWEDEEYHLVSVNGDHLPKPTDFGFTAEEITSPCTACWRGYQLIYNLNNERFILSKMLVHTKTDKIREINGISPKQNDSMFKYIYDDLNYEITFTGKLKIAQELIRGEYVHMGFQRPKAFKKVIKLYLDEGKLMDVEDVSEKYEEKRKQT